MRGPARRLYSSARAILMFPFSLLHTSECAQRSALVIVEVKSVQRTVKCRMATQALTGRSHRLPGFIFAAFNTLQSESAYINTYIDHIISIKEFHI